MTFKPLRDYIVIQKIEAENKVGSILIPENAAKPYKVPKRGKVLVISDKIKDKTIVKVGDIILYDGLAGLTHKSIHDDCLATLIKETDIITIIEE